MSSQERRNYREYKFLRSHPLASTSIGVLHTFLCSGIIFGWASLLPILHYKENISLSAEIYANIFTIGAIGNYMSSLPFGLLLDKCGPKLCGMAASVMYGTGLILCSFAKQSTTSLAIGFGLLGFSGPALQMPTLHLAKLFEGDARGGGEGGAAIYMSAQASAFDGGAAIFAIFAYVSQISGLSSATFFRFYLLVPLFTFLTAVLIWPNDILPDAIDCQDIQKNSSFSGSNHGSFAGPGSPFLTLSNRALESKMNAHLTTTKQSSLKDAPLSKVLTQPSFYCLASWVAVHILKLNFVVATINDQLRNSQLSDDTITNLVNIFGTMLPFGFVIMPLVAYLLKTDAMRAFQCANLFGIVYGAILLLFPDSVTANIIIVFPLVATSRQFVYSTVFHQIGALYGFSNYGILLGLANVVVSLISCIQTPLVSWAEDMGDYYGPNLILFLTTCPLFGVVWWTSDQKDTPIGNETETETEIGSKLKHAVNYGSTEIELDCEQNLLSRTSSAPSF